MIIIGYQGIGKSTVAALRDECIDLESSCTKVRGLRHECWADVYVNFAESLSRQGYFVFVSSHKEVQDLLDKSSENVIAIFPSASLKNEWVEKLKKRYELTNLDKDYAAWKGAEYGFDREIATLTTNGSYVKRIITSMNYNLENEIRGGINELRKET